MSKKKRDRLEVLGWKERVGVSLVVAAEAMALLRADYLPDLDVFLIHRGVSDAKVIEHTKTGDQHLIHCYSDFKPYLDQALKERRLSPYLFTCDESGIEGKPYTKKIYHRILEEACTHCNEVIDVCRKTETSTASQLMNEVGLSRAELQEETVIGHKTNQRNLTLEQAQQRREIC
jgi:hypothetical protein